MRKVYVTRSAIPDLLTLGNVFSGFAAIIYLADNNFILAAIYIFVAAIFDMLDGIAARILNATSEIGAELDSLCDAVSFGLAPSFMLYKAFFYQFNSLGILLSALPVIAGVFRLARFNVQLVSFEDKMYFKGMPIPAGALTIISYVLFYVNTNILSETMLFILSMIVVLAVPITMVSNIKYDNMPRPTKKSFKARPVFFIYVILAIIISIASKGYAIFPLMLIYMIVTPIKNGIVKFLHYHKKNKNDNN